MKKKLFQKIVCLILSVTTLFSLVGVTVYASEQGGTSVIPSNRDTAASLDQMQALVGISSYAEYLKANGDPDVVNKDLSLNDIDIDVVGDLVLNDGETLEDYVTSGSDICSDAFESNQSGWSGFGDNWDNTVYLSADGNASWRFHVEPGKAGYYYLRFTYYGVTTAESSISSIERLLYIDGRAAFDEASYVTFNKPWAYKSTVSEPTPTDKEDGVYVTYDKNGEEGYYKYVSEVKDGFETKTTYVIYEDKNGNSMAPSSEQISTWNTYYCQDSSGRYTGYFCFYLLEGDHQITLAAQREPVILSDITFEPYVPGDNALLTYEEVLKYYAEKGYTSAEDGYIRIEAEFPDMVSDSSVYPTNDNSSAQNFPSMSNAQLYNVIGENSYDTVGQWAAYKFKVNKTGLYKIGMRYLQDTLQGMYVCRTLRLSGGIYGLEDGTATVPFVEAYDTQFAYSKEWQSSYLGDSKGNVFEFYFEEGEEYTLYVECSLGSLGDLINAVEVSLAKINDCYLKILKLTGSTPSEYTYYKFELLMPEVLREFLLQSIELMRIKNELQELCGTNGSHIATLETIARLLDTMGSDDGWNIAANMSTLKSYLGTLGTWVNDSKKGTMMVDSIYICSANSGKGVLPKADANFFKAFWFEIESFIYSFFIKYDQMGIKKDTNTKNVETIDVWLATGRDQSNIWRSMLDETGGFSDRTGYAVALKLVTGGTLLPSILSGKGPDVYMGLGSADVINYAIRDAVLPLNDNDVFQSTYYTYSDGDGNYVVTKEEDPTKTATFISNPYDVHASDEYFVPAAKDTITLLGKSYGVPQTMAFPMMFYRMDILAELGEEVPDTWDALLKMLPSLQANNMNIGLTHGLAFHMVMYQNGGNMWKYIDNEEYQGAKVDLDSNTSLTAFEYVCKLYSEYSFPVSFDSANRFRTGEMPIIIGSYEDVYNKLVVYATEIDGMWSICPVPGTKLANGTINYDSMATVTATVMLHGCDNMLAAWEYIQWQTSADVQAKYGNKMVALIGPSAKYETANVEAIKNLSWTASERAAILDQIEHMSSIVNYPGSYIITRYVTFAFLDAVNNDADAVDSLSGYIDAINSEITRKRSEFGMKTLTVDQEPPET